MKSLKFVLLIIVSIICLNSCFTLASFCADHGCMMTGMPKATKKDPQGIYIVLDKKEYENYLKEILERKKEYVEVEGRKILLPENITLKKYNHDSDDIFGGYGSLVSYYLYDKEKQIGFPLGFRLDENENLMTGVIDGTNEYINKIGEHIYFSKSYPSEKDYVNRIGKDIYFTFGILSSTENEKKITNFLKELVKEW